MTRMRSTASGAPMHPGEPGGAPVHPGGGAPMPQMYGGAPMPQEASSSKKRLGGFARSYAARLNGNDHGQARPRRDPYARVQSGAGRNTRGRSRAQGRRW